MDSPDFPFTIVTIDNKTPQWAKMLYESNPNITQIRKLYHRWRQNNPEVKNGHTRNFRKLSGYLAYNNYVNQKGSIEIPTNEEIDATRNKILKDRATFKRLQGGSKARNSNNTTWQLVGPTFMKRTNGNLTDTHINIYSITQCLSNKDVLYCASESGGTVFKTTNHGDTWFSVSDDLITDMGSRNIEVAPSNPDIVYLCTKHDIFKTTVGGNTWTSVYNANNSSNRALIIHPTDPNIVMAGGSNGILKSTDGGANWTNPLPSKSIYDLRYKPGDTQTIYALVKNDATNLTEFYKSIDGGDTWSIRTTGWPMEAANSTHGGQMTTSDGNDNYIYAFIGATWTNANNSRNIKILKSLDYGESWTTVVDYDNSYGNSNINSGQGYYDWDIEMSDTNPDVVYGGTQGRWVTKDGFQTVNQNVGHLGHADVQETLFNGTDLWVVNDGGIILFDDENFQNYTPKSKGINAISYWSFDQGWNKDVSSATHYHNGTSLMNADYETNVGINLGGAEPSFSLVAHPNGEKMLSKGYGSVNGYTVPDAQDGTYTPFSYNLTPNIHNYGGNNVGVHPLATETHFLGVENALMKSVNFGVTWDTLYKLPTSNDFIWDIELTRANPNALFVSTIDNSGCSLYRSLDNGQSFVEITLPSQFSSTTKLNVSVSNEDENIFYVMADRYGIKIAKTVDGGTTWIDLDTPTLDAYDGHKIMQVDGTDGGIYLLTTRAVFYRNNTLPDWVALTNGMPANTSYNYIRTFYRDKELRIATSRGVYKAELYETPQLSDALLQPSTKKTTTECARDTFYFNDYSIVEHAGATWSWSFPGATYVSATNVRNPKVVYGNAGIFDVTMSITKGGQTFTRTVEKMITVGNACGTVDEVAGKSLKLNRATNDRAVTEEFGVTTNTFTFSAWIKPTGSFQAFQGVFSNGRWCAHCNDQTLGLIMNYGGDRLYYRWPGSTSGWSGASNLYPKLDEWSYVAMVMAPDKVTLYLNEEKWEQNISHDPATIPQLYLGFGHYTKYFNGEIEEATFWNRSLTDTEIKELMHLTKDPTTDPDLLAYYQFNEEEGDILDKASFYKARMTGGASRAPSSAPVGKGLSATQSESAGNVDFGTAGFTADFSNQSGIETVASKINNTPYNLNGLLTGDMPLADEYWAVHRYGTGDFTANLTFKTSVDISAGDAANPCQYALYKRGNRSDKDWAFVAIATTVDAGTNKITFTAPVDEWAQYLVVKSNQAIIRATSPVILKNTLVGATSAESSYTITGANLSADLQITAPSGFEISTTSGGGFTNNLSLTPTSGKVAATTIYVRFSPTEARLYSENIIHSSTGATNLLVEVQSNGIELDCFPGEGLSVDGSNDYVQVSNNEVFQFGASTDFSIALWMKTNNWRSDASLVSNKDWDSGRNKGWNIALATDNQGIDVNVGDGTNRADLQAGNLNDGAWHHIAATFDRDGQVSLYVDGVLQQSTSMANVGNIDNTLEMTFGSDAEYDYHFEGLIDEINIWNTVLTSAQIKEQMHLTLTGSESGLIAYYQFNETSGDVLEKINSLNGVFKNGATRSATTQPVGCGFSNTQTGPSGATTFTDTDITAFYTTTTDDVVATKINLVPNDVAGIGIGESAADQQYWVVTHYGGANDKNANLTFTLEEGIAGSETANSIKLYGRSQTSDGDWTLIKAADNIDAANNTVTFDNVMKYQQYLITKAPFPKITVDKSSLAFGNVDVNTNLTELSYTISASSLTADVDITAPSGFEISTISESGFTTTLTLSPTAGDIAATTIYVRFSPTAAGFQSGVISHTSTDATTQSISVDGTGVRPEIEVRQDATILASGQTIDFENSSVNSAKSLVFSIKNTDLGTLDLPNLPTITVTGTDASDFEVTEMPSDTSLTTNESTTFKVLFTPSSSGTKSATISIVNNDLDENPYTLNLTGSGDPLPTITVSNLTDFDNQLVGIPSAEKTYTVSGINLSEAVTLSATSGFEISLSSGSGFGSTLILPHNNGTLATMTIYVRFAPQGVSTFAGVINHVSTNAETKVVTVNGSSSKLAENVPGNTLNFDGIDDRINLGNPSELQITGDLTIQMWLKPTNFSQRRNPIHKAYGGEFSVTQETDGKISFYYGTNGGNGSPYQSGIRSNTALLLNGWNHISIVRDFNNDKAKIYINGVLDFEVALNYDNATAGNNTVYIGDGYTNHYAGSLDEVRVWDRALTTEEVQENMHLTLIGDEPNLVLYYQFNELNYSSVYNIKGTLHGGTGGATRTPSTIPVGGGFSDTKTESTGSIDFVNTDVNINFTAQNSAEVVVSKINLAPNTVPTGLQRVFNSQYWAIHRYGTGSFAGNITFKVAEDLTTGDAAAPDDILLYGRNFNSDMDWALVTAATSVDAANDQATFDAITNFDQFLIVASSDGTAAADCLADMVYENKNNLPNLNSSTTYIKAGNINGSGDVVIESGQDILFRAKDYIQLMPGFSVQAGANFTAKIEDCSAGLVAEIPEEKAATARTAPNVERSEPKTALDMNVYPNPFETQFFIDYRINKEAQVTIQLFDMSGKKVRDIMLDKRKKAGTYTARFTNRNLTAGTYILMIKIDKEIHQRKVVMSNRN